MIDFISIKKLPANSTIRNTSENEEEITESSEEEEDEESNDGKIDDDDDDEYEEEIDVIYQGNNAAFLSQVLELMQDFVESNKEKRKSANEEQFEQLKLEINGLKFANNISVEEMPQLLFLAFLRIPKTEKWLSTFKEVHKCH